MSSADTGTGDRLGSTVRPDRRVIWVHRIGALVVAAVIATFGVLGFAGGLGFFDTEGEPVLGMSTNGALSTISVVTALVLVVAAWRGGRFASTTMMVIGGLFLVSAFANLAVIGTDANLLAFALPNVFFSIGAGLVLLIVGAYGRVSSKLPTDNPYYLENHGDEPVGEVDPHQQPAGLTRDEQRADEAMAEAARAQAQGSATTDQRRRLTAMDTARTHEERRRIWMSFDRGDHGERRPAMA